MSNKQVTEGDAQIEGSKKSLVTLFPLDKKQKSLKEIRNEIKKKRLILDENKEKFGMDEFSQLIKVKNTSQVKGYPFKCSKANLSVTRGMKLALKVVPIETKYEKNEHPCNLENMVLKELTDNIVCKGISPHITYYLGSQKVSNKSRALKQLNLKRLEVEEKIRTHSNLLISEFVSGGSLDNWIFDTYENDKEITDEQWKIMVFQLIYTIAVIQHHYRMMHNDFHYGNILVDDSLQPGGYFVYEINGEWYYVKNTGIISKLWDFEFSMVYSDKIPGCYPNKFITGPFQYDKKKHVTVVRPEDLEDDDEVYNVPYNYNKVYDLHYFLTSLLDLYISQDLFDWIVEIYPEELIPEEESSYSSGTKRSDSESSDTDDESSDSEESQTEAEEEISDAEDSESSDSDSEDSDSSDSEGSESDKDSESGNKYLSEGRLINGVEENFKLPTPIDALKHSFFEQFKTKPADFDEATAIYFKAGF